MPSEKEAKPRHWNHKMCFGKIMEKTNSIFEWGKRGEYSTPISFLLKSILAALMVQELHCLLSEDSEDIHYDQYERRWTRLSMKDWKKAFPMKSESTLRRVLKKMEADGAIYSESCGNGRTHAPYYTVNYDYFDEHEEDVVRGMLEAGGEVPNEKLVEFGLSHEGCGLDIVVSAPAPSKWKGNEKNVEDSRKIAISSAEEPVQEELPASDAEAEKELVSGDSDAWLPWGAKKPESRPEEEPEEEAHYHETDPAYLEIERVLGVPVHAPEGETVEERRVREAKLKEAFPAWMTTEEREEFVRTHPEAANPPKSKEEMQKRLHALFSKNFCKNGWHPAPKEEPEKEQYEVPDFMEDMMRAEGMTEGKDAAVADPEDCISEEDRKEIELEKKLDPNYGMEIEKKKPDKVVSSLLNYFEMNLRPIFNGDEREDLIIFANEYPSKLFRYAVDCAAKKGARIKPIGYIRAILSREYQSNPEKWADEPAAGKEQHGQRVLLTNEEYQKLVDYFGDKEIADRRIELLDHYKCSKGINYASDYDAVLMFAKKDQAKVEESKSKGMSENTKFLLDILNGVSNGEEETTSQNSSEEAVSPAPSETEAVPAQ